MSEKKRRWFQIHLSTAIVLMFVAGVVLWVNLGWQHFLIAEVDGNVYHPVGWPVACVQRGSEFQIVRKDEQYPDRLTVEWFETFTLELAWKWIVPDLAAGSGVIVLAAVLSEFIIRRREARAR